MSEYDKGIAPPYNPQYPEVPPAFEYDHHQQGGGPPPGYPPHGGGYPQQPPAYPHSGPPPQGGGAAFSAPGPLQQTIVVAPMRFGEAPVSMNCPKCRASIITSTEHTSGTMSWVACAVICGAGFFCGGITWLGCCLIPFCISACQDVEHKCPNCQQMVGKMNRMG